MTTMLHMRTTNLLDHRCHMLMEDTLDMEGGTKDMISDTAMVTEAMAVTMVDTVDMDTEATEDTVVMEMVDTEVMEMVDTEAMVDMEVAMEEVMEDMAAMEDMVATGLVDLDTTLVVLVTMDSVDTMGTEEVMVVVTVIDLRFHKQLNHKNKLTRKTELLLVDLTSSTINHQRLYICLLYTSPSPRDGLLSRMPSSA